MAAIAIAPSNLGEYNSVHSQTKVSSSVFFACFSFLEVFIAMFEQCKHGDYFAWAGINPGISHPCNC